MKNFCGNFFVRRRNASGSGNDCEKIFDKKIVATQNITLAFATFLPSGHDAVDNILNGNNVNSTDWIIIKFSLSHFQLSFSTAFARVSGAIDSAWIEDDSINPILRNGFFDQKLSLMLCFKITQIKI